MIELWQAYDENGQPIAGKGLTKDEAYAGAPQGAAHVWIWRIRNGELEILLQKRAADKRTWGNLLDISAAGHIDLGEKPWQAAVREAREELGLLIDPAALQYIGETRQYLELESGDIEDEFVWLYGLRLDQETTFTLQVDEVAALHWKGLDEFAREVLDPEMQKTYVPHGDEYYQTVIDFIEQTAKRETSER